MTAVAAEGWCSRDCGAHTRRQAVPDDREINTCLCRFIIQSLLEELFLAAYKISTGKQKIAGSEREKSSLIPANSFQ